MSYYKSKLRPKKEERREKIEEEKGERDGEGKILHL